MVRLEHLGTANCRRIAGNQLRWSEHAGGNAIDIVGFVLADGRRISVHADWQGAGDAATFLRTVRDRVDDLIVDRDVDKLEREDRQAALDATLASLREEQRRMRRVLFWFGIAILVALLVGGWLVWDRYAALALLRYWVGGGAALAWGLLRGR